MLPQCTSPLWFLHASPGLAGTATAQNDKNDKWSGLPKVTSGCKGVQERAEELLHQFTALWSPPVSRRLKSDLIVLVVSPALTQTLRVLPYNTL